MKTRSLSFLLVLALLLPVCFASAAEGPVTLRFMWWGSDARHEATIAVCEQYMALHPNVTIEFEYGGYDGYFEKLTTYIASGTEADIIQFDTKATKDLLALGDIFVDLNTLSDVLDTSTFDETMLNGFGKDGEKLIALPTGTNATAILVNTSITDAAGIDVHAIATWDDLIAAAEQLKAYDPNMHLLNVEVMNLGETFGYMVLSQLIGDNILNQGETQLNITPDDLKAMFELYERFYESGVLEPAENSILYDTNPWTNPKWINHQYAMGYFITSFINKNTYDFQDTSAVIPMPQFAGAKESGVMYCPAQMIGISSNCKAPEVAADFLNYFFNDETAVATLGTVRSIPSTSVGLKVCNELGIVDPNIITAIGFAEETATDHQNRNMSTSLTDILKEGAERIAYGLGSAEEIAQQTYDELAKQVEYLKN